MTSFDNLSRRHFLSRTGLAGLASTPVLSSLLNLRLMNSAVAATNNFDATGYRALVCVFLAGGNDSFNMLVPRGAVPYSEYSASRGRLALASNSLLPISHQNGSQYGVHPAMPDVQNLYNQGDLGFVANVGTLVEPTTVADFNAGRNLPVGLFSHKDQIQHWQTSLPQSRGALSGWSGRVADMLTDTVNLTSSFGLNIGIGEFNAMQKGNQTNAFVVDRTGNAIELNPFQLTPAKSILQDTYQNIFAKTYAAQSSASIDLAKEYSQLTGSAVVNTPFPASGMGSGLKGVARAIASRSALGMQRQIFFVQLGGFDHHDDVLVKQQEKLTEVSQALGAFWNALVELGMTNNVTTFTASDFGRTLSSNNDGSDHGWGGNQMVMGGAVRGGRIYGTFPGSLAVGNPLDTGRGRFLPTTSVDEFNAELAMWFGVPNDGSLEQVLPNIRNFYAGGSTVGPLGFL